MTVMRLLQLAMIAPAAASVAVLAAAPFVVGWTAEQLIHRWRTRRR